VATSEVKPDTKPDTKTEFLMELAEFFKDVKARKECERIVIRGIVEMWLKKEHEVDDPSEYELTSKNAWDVVAELLGYVVLGAWVEKKEIIELPHDYTMLYVEFEAGYAVFVFDDLNNIILAYNWE